MKKIILFLFILIFSYPTFADTKLDLGSEVYANKAMCGSCHSLKSANSEGDIGPNLDQLKPQISQIILAIKNGIGVMPSFEGILTTDEIEAVAYYVFKNTNK